MAIGPTFAAIAATLAARQDPGRMNQLILSEWRDDDYGVGAVVGRIMRVAPAREATPWMWTLAYRRVSWPGGYW